MDRSSYKLYHKDQPDTRPLLETYFTQDPNSVFKDDSLTDPMEKFHNAFSKGQMTGNLLIDISGMPFIHHLYSACGFFKDIILMRLNEKCILEILKWKNDLTGAFFWGHAASRVVQLEGKGDESEAKELELKSAIKQVVKCEAETESLADLIGGQQADCVMTAWLLGTISENEEEYMKHMRKILDLLKPGGHLVMLSALNTSYYTCGEHRYNVFKYDENFVKKALTAEGMTVLQCDIIPRKSESDLIDYNGVLFLVALKQK
ncbi:nicotinamide N-methyltransferase-like [Hyperolius riggenbachi]|uniref:nicotinamide N-methyltransferase-like n=1 Tax=Hyperolius riggenbachi TaxID=752182 RepID=UPI0035A3499C